MSAATLDAQGIVRVVFRVIEFIAVGFGVILAIGALQLPVLTAVVVLVFTLCCFLFTILLEVLIIHPYTT